MSDIEQEPIMTQRGRDARTGHSRIGRAWGAILSAVAVLAVAAAAVAASTGGHAPSAGATAGASAGALARTSANGVVPWTGRPAPAYTAPVVAAPAAPRALYPACTASDLAGSVSATYGIGTGRYTRYLVLKNVSGGACTLSGAPGAVAGVRQGGSRATLNGPASTVLDPNLSGPANLRPGQSAQVAITTVSMCTGSAATCARSSYAQVVLTIGGGQVRFAFPARQPFSMVNSGGIAVSAFGVPAPPPAAAASPLDVLKVSTTASKTLAAGGTENFQVTLRNPTGRAVALSPCPSYAEFVTPLGSSPRSQVHRYYLNCGAASTVPAGGSVTFAMRLPVPDKAGAAKYGWVLQGTSLQFGGAAKIG
ncbi:MAG TPA: DUF4232 domain-containing protein [Streptosporangiaceae bacterium]|nr:DUF4232 domain-containing protein [Streptosporangiaceae bacterium]